MAVRIAAIAERLRASLFFEPLGFVVVAIVLAFAGLWVDGEMLETDPDRVRPTPRGRALLNELTGLFLP